MQVERVSQQNHRDVSTCLRFVWFLHSFTDIQSQQLLPLTSANQQLVWFIVWFRYDGPRAAVW